MKPIFLFSLLFFVGCASAAPLPLPKSNALVTFTNQAVPPQLAGNRLWLLTNSAPDFAAGIASTNWTPGPISAPTNALTWPNLPVGSLLTASALDPVGNEAAATNPVVFQPIAAPINKP